MDPGTATPDTNQFALRTREYKQRTFERLRDLLSRETPFFTLALDGVVDPGEAGRLVLDVGSPRVGALEPEFGFFSAVGPRCTSHARSAGGFLPEDFLTTVAVDAPGRTSGWSQLLGASAGRVFSSG